MNRKITAIVWGILFLSCVMLGGGQADAAPAQKPLEWKFVCDYPPADLQMAKAVPKFAQDVEKASGGRIKVAVYSGGQLVPPTESFDNLRAGTFQFLQTAGPYHAGKLPAANPSFLLPMGPRDSSDYRKLFADYGLFDLISKAYKTVGIHYLTPTPYSGANIISRIPLRTLKDFKGAKIRTTGLQAALWKLAGATPVFIPGGEVYLALQTGVVDGATWSNPSIEGMKFGEVTKFMICSHPFPRGNSTCVPNGAFLVNEQAFNSLPKDLQEVIVTCARQYSEYTEKIYNDWDDWFHKGGGKQKYGMEAIVLSEEETNLLRQRAVAEIWPGVAAKDSFSAKYVETVTKYLKDKGVLK